jgi:hypothetical protein
MMAEDVIGDGAAATAFSVGEEETAFHGWSPEQRKSPLWAGFFLFLPISSGYQMQR